MTTCLIIEPVHPVGPALLQAAGIRVRSSPSSDPATVGHEIAGCAAAIIRSSHLPAEVIAEAPLLRVIGVHGTGSDKVDVAFATQAGIAVVNTPFANVRSVAEQAVALMLALARDVVRADAAVRTCDFGFKFRARLVELEGLTCGIVGFGRIGQATARLASAIGMRVIAYSPNQPDAAFLACGVERAESIDAVLRGSDFVSLHLPATAATRRMIGRRELALMKPSAFLVNTSRGDVLDEPALIAALLAGSIAGAGLDVFEREAMPPDHPLLGLRNVILSPHLGGSTQAALKRTAKAVAEAVIAVLEGRPPAHLVNPDVWPRRRLA